MPLKVVTFAEYLTAGERSAGHWNAFKFIRAIKGMEFTGYAWVPVVGKKRKLTEATAHLAKKWFAEMAAAHLASRRGLPQPLGFVPIPSSRTTAGSSGSFTALELALLLVKQYGRKSRLEDVLRWSRPMASAHRGSGERDPAALYPYLELTMSPSTSDLVMIDDVVTTGGHLQAAAGRLRADGATVLGALCAGRTVWEPGADAFAVQGVEYEDWEP